MSMAMACERADGTALELVVSVSQDDRQSIDAMALVKEDWEAVGLKTVIAPDQGAPSTSV